MSILSLLEAIVSALEEVGIDYMVAGSFASSHHGQQRSTNDIDIVVDCTEGDIDRLIDHLDSRRFYVSRSGAREAVRRRDQFNVIDSGGWKVDVIVRKDRGFSAEEFRRRIPADIAGVRVYVATAEDTILAKLEWSKESGSDVQRRDVAELVRLRPDLDEEYLDRWAGVLGVTGQLEAARREAGLDA